MRVLSVLLGLLSLVRGDIHERNGCISFTVSPGTGCAWMCEYCSTTLGTNNYYFTDGVCTYEQGQGCVGNPFSGKMYTCCSTSTLYTLEHL